MIKASRLVNWRKWFGLRHKWSHLCLSQSRCVEKIALRCRHRLHRQQEATGQWKQRRFRCNTTMSWLQTFLGVPSAPREAKCCLQSAFLLSKMSILAQKCANNSLIWPECTNYRAAAALAAFQPGTEQILKWSSARIQTISQIGLSSFNRCSQPARAQKTKSNSLKLAENYLTAELNNFEVMTLRWGFTVDILYKNKIYDTVYYEGNQPPAETILMWSVASVNANGRKMEQLCNFPKQWCTVYIDIYKYVSIYKHVYNIVSWSIFHSCILLLFWHCLQSLCLTHNLQSELIK